MPATQKRQTRLAYNALWQAIEDLKRYSDHPEALKLLEKALDLVRQAEDLLS